MHRVQTIGTIEELIAPSFTLTSAPDGEPVSLYAFRQRQPVGLLFVPQGVDISSVLNEARPVLDGFRLAKVALLVIVREPFAGVPAEAAVLVDHDGSVFSQYECPAETICLFGLDRYGAVVHQSACELANLKAALRTLLDAIEFSEIRCPE